MVGVVPFAAGEQVDAQARRVINQRAGTTTSGCGADKTSTRLISCISRTPSLRVQPQTGDRPADSSRSATMHIRCQADDSQKLPDFAGVFLSRAARRVSEHREFLHRCVIAGRRDRGEVPSSWPLFDLQARTGERHRDARRRVGRRSGGTKRRVVRRLAGRSGVNVTVSRTYANFSLWSELNGPPNHLHLLSPTLSTSGAPRSHTELIVKQSQKQKSL